MKVLQINIFNTNGSTGRIVRGICDALQTCGHEAYTAYAKGEPTNENNYKIQTEFGYNFSIIQTRILGKHGFFDVSHTKKLINWIRHIAPDIIHLHNIHGHYINIEILLQFLKEYRRPVIWSLHDCWAFTGHCAHFDYIGCEKWKTLCHDCPQLAYYPITWFFDKTASIYKRKKEIITGAQNIRFVVPSKWMLGCVGQSYLQGMEVHMIPNGIDTKLFAPTESDIKGQLGIEDKKMLLGVAFAFNERKGVDYFNKLAELLPEDHKLVLLGVEERHKHFFNYKIMILHRTNSEIEMAKVYSSADVYINPTLEETQGMTNIEALSCGVPVVTFDSGGSPECITKMTGKVVDRGNIEGFYRAALDLADKKTEYSRHCREYAVSNCDKKRQNERYLRLYKEVLLKR